MPVYPKPEALHPARRLLITAVDSAIMIFPKDPISSEEPFCQRSLMWFLRSGDGSFWEFRVSDFVGASALDPKPRPLNHQPKTLNQYPKPYRPYVTS